MNKCKYNEVLVDEPIDGCESAIEDLAVDEWHLLI